MKKETLSSKIEIEKKRYLSKELYSAETWTAIKRIEQDVREFIKLLKEDTGCKPINSREEQIIALFKERIDKLAGEELIK